MESRVAGSLLAMLAEIPDPRGRQGLRHPLAAMLAEIVCGILSGGCGYLAIAEWVHYQDASVWQWLGFRRKPPCTNTFCNLLLALLPELLENVLRRWVRGVLGEPAPDELLASAIGGKTLAAHERIVQLLAFLDQQAGGVLGSRRSIPRPMKPKRRSDS